MTPGLTAAVAAGWKGAEDRETGSQMAEDTGYNTSTAVVYGHRGFGHVGQSEAIALMLESLIAEC